MTKKRLRIVNALMGVLLALSMISNPLAALAARGEITQTVAAQAQPSLMLTSVLVDDFDYGNTAGDLTSASSNAWSAHSGAGTGPVQYITTSLSMPGYGSSGVGGAATISTTGSEDINQTFPSQTSGTVYFATLINISAAGGGAYFLHFKDAGSNFRARVFARNDAGVLRFGIGDGSTGTYSDDAFDYDKTYLLVAKFDVTTGDTALHVLEAPSTTEPPPLLSVSGTALNIQSVAIRQASGGPAATIDGVRVATTWEDVIGYVADEITLTKTVTPTTNVDYHGTVTYTLVLDNNLAISDTVFLTDTLPTEVTFGAWIENAAGAVEDSDQITWSGTLTASTTLTFTFTAIHTGDYGDIITNTAEFSATAQTGTAEATFTVANLLTDVTFVYHDLEGVVEAGETVWIAGDFNAWAAAQMGDAGGGVYTYTVAALTIGDTYEYRYIVNDGSTDQSGWLNTADRSYTVVDAPERHDYRNVVINWANLQWPFSLQTNAFEATSDVYGQMLINGLTGTAGPARGIIAEVGYGDTALPRADWEWFPMTYNVPVGNNDEFMGVMTPTLGGVFDYSTRYDANGGIGNPNAAWYNAAETGVLTVTLYDVAVTKTTLVDTVYVFDGDSALVTYTIAIENLSSLDATDTITLHDILPAGFAYVTDYSPVTPSEASGVLTWVFNDPLAAGETLSFTLVLRATDAVAQTGLHTNEVVIEVAPADTFTDNNTAADDVMVYRAVPISTARAGSNGQIFTLEGVVTAPNDTWNNAPEWTLQDASGGIAAYFIATPAVALGDTVRMVATRGAYQNQEQMTNPTYFEIVSSGPPVMPITYTTGQVASGSSEGWLVEIEGEVGSMPATCGSAYNITLNDGSGAATVRVESATGINLCALGIENGDMLGVTGFSTQFQTTYQVKPRSMSDLHLFTDAPLVIGTTPTNNATNVPTDTLITINFSELVTVSPDWAILHCSESGLVSATTTPAGPASSYTLTPDAPLAYGEICHVTVLADQVSNAEMMNMLADYRFSFITGPALTFGACGNTAIPINFVQGSGESTPILGTTVVIEAVVVGSYQGAGQFSGFFLQERDHLADDDPMTSEGIFVYTTLTTVAPGDLVRVLGTATEFNGLTQIASVTTGNIAVCDTGFTVTPAEMTLPVDDMMAWEAVEGMQVSFNDDLVVTEHYQLGRYGVVQLSVNDRLWNPTNVVTPGAEALALQDLNNRSRVMLDDGINLQNPDPVIYPDPRLTYTNTLRTGALVHDLLGVVDYRSNSYRLQPVNVISFTHTADRPYEMDAVGGTLKIASFNVLNYFTTLNSRGANSLFEFERQRTKIINAILEMDADIVGLIEIENHATDDAVLDLVAGINALAGAGTYAYIDTGVIGTDEIKMAYIYQPSSVTPVGDYVILDSSVDPRFVDTKNRPVLIQTFAENSTGELVTVAVNHLKSKGSDCNDLGDPDMGDGQGNCNVTRTNAAEALVDYLATDPTNSGSPHFLIIGDLNSYAMEDPITAIRDAGYTDLLRAFYGDAAYSYVFDGQAGHLDHALASPELMPFVTGATAWHINADEPLVLDYNVEFKTGQQISEWYSPEPFRSSDHDPVIVGLNLATDLSITKAVMPTSDVGLGDVVTYTISLNNDGEVLAWGIELTDTLPVSITFGGFLPATNVTPDYAAGVITWAGDLPAGIQNIVIVFTATVNVDNALYGETITNTVAFTSENAGDGMDEAAFTIVMTTEPELSITKSVVPTTQVDLSDIVTYTINLTNEGGGVASDILVTDALPTGITFESFVAQNGASEAAGVITWSGELVAGENLEIIFTATVDDDPLLYGETITNTVAFTSENAGDGMDEAAFTVMEETITMQVTFMYHDLEGVVPDGTTIHIAGNFNGWNSSATPMIGDSVTGIYTATITLETAPYTLDYKLILGDNWDDGRGDLLNSDNRSALITESTTLHLYRNVRAGYAKLNGPAEITIPLGATTPVINGEAWFSNTFDENQVLRAQIGYGTDADPANWTWVEATFSGRNGNNDIFTTTLMPTAAGVYSYTIRFDGNWGDGNPNTTWYLGDLAGTHPDNPFDIGNVGVLTVTEPAPLLNISKSVLPVNDVELGDTVTYTLQLSNAGSMTAYGILLTDTLPTGVTFSAFVDNDGLAVENAGVITWSGDLEAGEEIVIVFTVTVDADDDLQGETITNTVAFTSSNAGDGAANAAFTIAAGTTTDYFIFLPLVMRNFGTP